MAGTFDAKPVPKPPSDNIYTFVYKNGPAPMTAAVRAKDEAEAYKVACHWCRMQEFRPPARVVPFVVAGPEILKESVPSEVEGYRGAVLSSGTI